jgi:hypothetical protein
VYALVYVIEKTPGFIVIDQCQVGQNQFPSLDPSEGLYSKDGSKRVVSDINDVGLLWVNETVAVGMDVPTNSHDHVSEGERYSAGRRVLV